MAKLFCFNLIYAVFLVLFFMIPSADGGIDDTDSDEVGSQIASIKLKIAEEPSKEENSQASLRTPTNFERENREDSIQSSSSPQSDNCVEEQAERLMAEFNLTVLNSDMSEIQKKEVYQAHNIIFQKIKQIAEQSSPAQYKLGEIILNSSKIKVPWSLCTKTTGYWRYYMVVQALTLCCTSAVEGDNKARENLPTLKYKAAMLLGDIASDEREQSSKVEYFRHALTELKESSEAGCQQARQSIPMMQRHLAQSLRILANGFYPVISPDEALKLMREAFSLHTIAISSLGEEYVGEVPLYQYYLAERIFFSVLKNPPSFHEVRINISHVHEMLELYRKSIPKIKDIWLNYDAASRYLTVTFYLRRNYSTVLPTTLTPEENNLLMWLDKNKYYYARGFIEYE